MNKCIMASLVLLTLATGANGTEELRKPQNTQNAPNDKSCALQLAMAKLWSEHVLWTRQVIVSSLAGLGDQSAATQRLLKNQDDIGNAIVPFYGQQAGKQLAGLLRQHISIYANIINAVLAKDNQKVNTLYAQWYANAADIAAFLSSINPYFNQKSLNNMLNEHLKLTGNELQLRIAGNWAADVANFDMIFMQAQMMAKGLADGIIKQFPTKFFKI